MSFRTPAGFVEAVAQVRERRCALTLYLDPKRYACTVRPVGQRRPQGTVKVGSYFLAEHDAMVHIVRQMRADLEGAIEKAEVPRGTSRLRLKSMSYRKCDSTAGRRSV